MPIILPNDLDAVPREQTDVEIRPGAVAAKVSLGVEAKAEIEQLLVAGARDIEIGSPHEVTFQAEPAAHQTGDGDIEVRNALPWLRKQGFELVQIVIEIGCPAIMLFQRSDMLSRPLGPVVDGDLAHRHRQPQRLSVLALDAIAVAPAVLVELRGVVIDEYVAPPHLVEET